MNNEQSGGQDSGQNIGLNAESGVTESIVTIPGPAVGYTDLIDKALNQKEAVESQENRYPLRPSAAGYCARRLAYSLMNFKGKAAYPNEVKEPETIRLLNLGNSVEYHSIKNFDLIKTVIPEMQVKYKQQMVTFFRLDPISDGTAPLIEGSLDFALVMTNTGGLGDVKSRKDKFSRAFKTDWDESIDKFNQMNSLVKISDTAWYADDLLLFIDELNDPFFADNFYQVNGYLCTEWAKEHNLDHGFIYRYNKNDSRHLEIRFKPCPELFEYVKTKFNQINQAVDRGAPEEIDREYLLGSSRCAFCPFSKVCWGDGTNALKEYFKTWPKKQWPVDVESTSELGMYMNAFEELSAGVKEKDALEQKIIKFMLDNKLKKIRLGNKNIYEIREFKSPRPHFELRRTKL